MPDEAAVTTLERLMDAYAPDVFRCCVGMLRDRHAAEDASQETFLRAFRGHARLRKQGSEKAWLLSIAINVCRDQLRRPQTQRERPVADIEPHAGSAPPPGEGDAALAEAVHALAPRQREAILLHYYHDLDCEETARAMGVRVGTVFTHLERGRRALKEALREKGEETHEAQCQY